MANVNFKVKNGLQVGTGVTITASGIITATSVSVGGSITAASFYGDGSNLVNAGSSLSPASDLQRVVLTDLTSGTMTSAATSSNLTYNSSTNTLSCTNISIAGTITYEDTTNVDSIGVITARTGIKVTSGGIDITSGGLNVTSGVSTFQANIYLGDNDNIIIGDGSDLKLYHTGSNSFIDDAGTGNLYIRGSNSVQIESIGGESSAKFNENGAVELYYDNSKEFETTGYGATVYGTLETQGLNVSGITTVLSSNLKIRNPANTFEYSIVGSAIAANRNLTLPLLTADDTVAVLGLSQTFSADKTFTGKLTAQGEISLTGSATATHSYSTSQTTAAINLGGVSGTGTITLGRATTSQTTNIQAGATSSGNTKTINLGTGGLSGSFTQINIGPTAGVGTVAFNTGTEVGIGSTIPTVALDVVGDAKISGIATITTLSATTLRNYGETVNVVGNTGTAATINLANGNFVTATLTGNCTFTFTTGLSSGAISFTLVLTNDGTAGRSIVWPAAVKWPNGTTPVRTTTANKTDVYTFFTSDNGTNWFGNLSLYNYS